MSALFVALINSHSFIYQNRANTTRANLGAILCQLPNRVAFDELNRPSGVARETTRACRSNCNVTKPETPNDRDKTRETLEKTIYISWLFPGAA
jgi:hypothetical protein